MAYLDGRVGTGVVTVLRLHSTSQAEDVGFLAMHDIAAVADDTGIEYRIVGGQMIRLHVFRTSLTCARRYRAIVGELGALPADRDWLLARRVVFAAADGEVEIRPRIPPSRWTRQITWPRSSLPCQPRRADESVPIVATGKWT